MTFNIKVNGTKHCKSDARKNCKKSFRPIRSALTRKLAEIKDTAIKWWMSWFY